MEKARQPYEQLIGAAFVCTRTVSAFDLVIFNAAIQPHQNTDFVLESIEHSSSADSVEGISDLTKFLYALSFGLGVSPAFWSSQQLGGGGIAYGVDDAQFCSSYSVGETLRACYEISSIDNVKGLSIADVSVRIERDGISTAVVAAQHITKLDAKLLGAT